METITRNIPVLALRGLTAFPGQTVSFDAERDISIFALDNAMENDRRLLAMTQKDLSTAEPGEEDLYTIGTVCHILQIIKTSDTTVRVIAEGESRARLHRLWQKKPFLQAQAELLPEMAARHTARSEALIRRTYVLFGEYRELANGIGEDFAAAVLDCGRYRPSGRPDRPEYHPAAPGPPAGAGGAAPGQAPAYRQRYPDP